MENASTGNNHLPHRNDGLPPIAAPEIPTPGMVSLNLARFKKSDNLRRDADKVYAAARVARNHNLPGLDNALIAFANKLSQESRDVRNLIKTVQNVELTPENQGKL